MGLVILGKPLLQQKYAAEFLRIDDVPLLPSLSAQVSLGAVTGAELIPQHIEPLLQQTGTLLERALGTEKEYFRLSVERFDARLELCQLFARQPLPEHLPREVKIYPPKQQACDECGGRLRPLGEDVSELLEWVPGSFKVLRIVRPKLSCAGCERIVQAPAPSRPIERGLAGPGLLAHVLVAKYCDHQPLYRQAEMYAREGVELERSTLADWVGGSSRLLEPLVEALRRHVVSAHKLHADDAGSGAGSG